MSSDRKLQAALALRGFGFCSAITLHHGTSLCRERL
jgi:hypothetical protein